MRTWTVWFEMVDAKFMIVIEAKNWDKATEAAIAIANRLGATFDYEMDEVTK